MIFSTPILLFVVTPAMILLFAWSVYQGIRWGNGADIKNNVKLVGAIFLGISFIQSVSYSLEQPAPFLASFIWVFATSTLLLLMTCVIGFGLGAFFAKLRQKPEL